MKAARFLSRVRPQRPARPSPPQPRPALHVDAYHLSREQAIALIMDANRDAPDPFTQSAEWAAAELHRIRLESRNHLPKTATIPSFRFDDGSMLIYEGGWRLVQLTP